MTSGPGSDEAWVAVACPDKFRGSLKANDVAAAMGRGLGHAGFDVVRTLPLADGGEGTLDALLHGKGGEQRLATVTGPLGEPVEARYAVLSDGTAVVEMADASGLALTRGENDPVAATTRGTGELIAIAARSGVARIVVGVGGSATTDGGLGALEAIGWSLEGLEVVVACDVDTRFVDAARVFGPQKGADRAQIDLLSRRLERLADEFEDRTGLDVRDLRGSGAAGGLAGGLAALGARLEGGFDVVAEAVGLDGALTGSALVVTGEGLLDSSSFEGKVVGRVLDRARRSRVPHVGVIVGEVAAGARENLRGEVALQELTALAPDRTSAFEQASALIEHAALEVGRGVIGEPREGGD